jgi:hypothetical protein
VQNAANFESSRIVVSFRLAPRSGNVIEAASTARADITVTVPCSDVKACVAGGDAFSSATNLSMNDSLPTIQSDRSLSRRSRLAHAPAEASAAIRASRN